MHGGNVVWESVFNKCEIWQGILHVTNLRETVLKAFGRLHD